MNEHHDQELYPENETDQERRDREPIRAFMRLLEEVEAEARALTEAFLRGEDIGL